MPRMMTRFDDYDPFARMYNAHWGPQTERHIGLLERHVLNRVPAPAHILDLCCGTGQLARILSDKGYRVLGIDGSEGMLGYARSNATDVEFEAGDARSFKVAEPVDAVTCLFGSLNHMMEESDLQAVFGAVAGALRPGGLFAFDLNMEAKYLRSWSGDFSVPMDNKVAVVRCSVDSDARRGIFDAILFFEDEDESWDRHDVHLAQTWYDRGTVERLLAEAGFEVPTVHVKGTLPDDPEVAQSLLFVTTRSA